MAYSSGSAASSTTRGQRLTILKLAGAILIGFLLLGSWLVLDLQRGYDKVLADTSYRAMQRAQIIGQAFRTEVLAADYVLRDVLGRFQEADLVYPDPDADHARRMTMLLKEKADTVPDFFSMVIFNRDCVFAVTPTGKNTGVQSKAELCTARKLHDGPGPMASYVSGKSSASGRSVLVLSRHLRSASGDFLGGVMGVIELDRAQRRFDALSMEHGDSVALLDEGQVLLARRPQLPDLLEKRVASPAFSAELQTQASAGTVAAQADVDGHERLFGFSKIDGFPFVIAYGFDKTLALREWQRRAAELGVGYFVLLVLAVFAARAHWVTLRQRDALMASETALQELATRDGLTGLYNRRFLDAVLSREIARSEREKQQLAIIMLDVDHFKKVNDQYGHAAGDEVLKALAALLKTGARESDLICRYGGEEFVAVMPDMSAEQAVVRAESWRKQLEDLTLVVGEFRIKTTVSAGIAVFPDHGTSPDRLLNLADEMPYQSKNTGRNRTSLAPTA
ncbi:diguanylate cyclase [Rhodoferax sp. AJA081-3]|uniref:sensor domain-containing diguanylate cyclase n=1 Tax=Rhodoferax sp. AJA081-3 TaxID=2752316 RepID=UPI001ADFB37B|nr:sensor domain-containing diguanylate cyclase [Rhodoferax sp. AJA081-3]QTN26447.1 diguanylate cyclase [Rhodoferax sp. AJA081-3]